MNEMHNETLHISLPTILQRLVSAFRHILVGKKLGPDEQQGREYAGVGPASEEVEGR